MILAVMNLHRKPDRWSNRDYPGFFSQSLLQFLIIQIPVSPYKITQISPKFRHRLSQWILFMEEDYRIYPFHILYIH